MINVPEIAKIVVTPEVVDFMDSYGGNHVSLYKGWKERPEMHNGITNLEEELAYTIQEKNLPLAKRIMGRIRKVSSKWEDGMLDDAMSAEPAPSCLG